jgi:L-asparagine transporter-like permease
MNQAKSGARQEEKKLQWWQLSLLGVACTIGTGYFLGSSIAIKIGGPSVIIAFLLAALGTYTVFDALSRMTSDEPIKGSFRSYAKKAYGRWAGFSSGWVYWCSELLIMGSQLTALSIFSTFWLPNVPLWIFAASYGVLGVAVILTGTTGFERLENLFAVIKISAILMFLVIAGAALLGYIDGKETNPAGFPRTVRQFMPNGIAGLWSSLIYAFYAFGGIEIMGLMAMRLRKPQDAPKSGKIMLSLLAFIYVLSLVLAVTMVSWTAFQSKKSPFAVALGSYPLPFVPHAFNAVLIIAGFSTMVASLFAVTGMLVTLAEDRDAPSVFTGKKQGRLPLSALALTAGGMTVSVILSLLMPGRIYEYFTTAAGLMLLYNWLFILITSGRLLQPSVMGRIKRFTGLALLLLAVSGTLFHGTSRPGFYVSLMFIGAITVVTLFMRTKWNKSQPKGRGGDMPHLKKERFISFQSEIEAEPDERQSGKHGNKGKEPAR